MSSPPHPDKPAHTTPSQHSQEDDNTSSSGRGPPTNSSPVQRHEVMAMIEHFHQENERRQQEDNARFTALTQMMATLGMASQPDPASARTNTPTSCPQSDSPSLRKNQEDHTDPASLNSSSEPCQYCLLHHSAKCPAADSACYNCGIKGHWTKSPKCPAIPAQCQVCNRRGHFTKYCQQKAMSPKNGASPRNIPQFKAGAVTAYQEIQVMLPQGACAIQDDADVILCKCGHPAMRRKVVKDTPNKGKMFYNCSARQGHQCNFFQWEDEMHSGGAGRRQDGGNCAAKRTLNLQQQPAKRKCSVCGNTGHNKRNCPNRQH